MILNFIEGFLIKCVKSKYVHVFWIVPFFFLLTFISCVNKTDVHKYEHTANVKVIEKDEDTFMDITFDEINKEYYLSQIVDTIFKYIKLQSDSSCYIAQIEKICFLNDKIFILDKADNGKLLVFSNSGNFIGTIGKKGRGPSEYFSISDFYLDSINGNLIMLDTYKNEIKYYDLFTFQYLKSKTTFRSKSFYKSGELIYFYNWYYTNEKLPFKLIVTDTLLNVMSKHFPYTQKNSSSSSRAFYLYNDTVIFYEKYSNKVFNILNGNLDKRYVINFKGRNYDYYHDFNNFKKLELSNKIIFNGHFIETQDHLIIEVVASEAPHRPYTIFYSKNTNNYFSGNAWYSNLGYGITIGSKILDNRKDTMISYIPAEIVNKFRKEGVKDDPLTKDIIEKSDFFENPVICYFRLKKF
jgi:hypothetical protein